MSQKWSPFKCSSLLILLLFASGCATSKKSSEPVPAEKPKRVVPEEQVRPPRPDPRPMVRPPKKDAQKPVTKPKPVAQRPSHLPPLLWEVEKKYQRSRTLMADFVQTKNVKEFNRKQVNEGILQIKRPNKVRWETKSPDQSLLVSDGQKFWFYTPPFEEGEMGQVVIRRSQDVQSEMARALLIGSFSVAKDMKITEKRSSVFEMRPKRSMGAGIKLATVYIESSSKTISRVVLDHVGGNRTEVELKNIQLGKRLDSELFDFRIPPRTDVIRQ